MPLAGWHMRNPEKNHGSGSPRGCLIELAPAGTLRSCSTITARMGSNTCLSSCSVPPNESPLRRAWLHRQAGLCNYPDDVLDSEFFGYNPTRFSDDDEGGTSAFASPYSSHACGNVVIVTVRDGGGWG